MEIDHIPGRAVFEDRQWPETYEFPACARCNRASRWDESVVAMLSRVYPGSAPKDQEQFKKIVQDLSRHRPEILSEMSLDIHQKREELRQRGMRPAPGKTYADVPIVAVDGPLVSGAIRGFTRKLGLALYYKHAGRPLPLEGAMWGRWWTNWSATFDPIPQELQTILPELPRVTRNSTDLSDQFFYRCGVPDGAEMASFLAVFRQSFAIAIFAGIDTARFGQIPATELLRPFNPTDPE